MAQHKPSVLHNSGGLPRPNEHLPPLPLLHKPLYNTYIYTANVLEILLSLSLLVHGIQDGLTLGLVPLPQLINLPLHLLVQCGHALVQLLVRQVLQLQARWGVREDIAEMKEGGGGCGL